MHDEKVPVHELPTVYQDDGDGARSKTADARLSLLFAEWPSPSRRVYASRPPPMILLGVHHRAAARVVDTGSSRY